ncbi:MAG: polysaccharide deacetylase family protein [Planctomycetes bacterium]|nr:polysaccharide deacetylase family protein [Planctomycetota bacterium]
MGRHLMPFVLVAVLCAPVVAGEQLLNLPLDRTAFPVPADIVWPQAVGEPHICLWYGDKFAALSITIDDNWKPDWAWWMQMAETYDFTPTWFTIVGGVDAQSNPGFSGVWSDFVALAASGGSIQSHTMTHNCSDDTRPDADVHWEYSRSQALIDANVPGQRCLTLAYPCGVGRPDIAAQYFIAARGVHGTPNKPGRINWMMTDSSSGRIDADFVNAILYGTSGISWLNSPQWKRAWLCTHYHGVSDEAVQEGHLAYIDSLRHLIWWASFIDVVRFGQQRDSATITMVENSESRIAFDISDRMNDQIFDHPLTIKLRLPDAWEGAATATQGGAATSFTLAAQGDRDYILLDAIPDRGPVEIRPGSADKPGDADRDGDVDLDDFVLLKTSFGTLSGAAWDQGDFDADGDVDLDDFVILKTNFGR